MPLKAVVSETKFNRFRTFDRKLFVIQQRLTVFVLVSSQVGAARPGEERLDKTWVSCGGGYKDAIMIL